MPGRRRIVTVLMNKDGSGAVRHPTIRPRWVSTRFRNKPKAPKGAFAQKVNKVISRSRETKLSIAPPINYSTNDTLEQFTAHSSAITSTNEIYMLIPPVAQGNNDNQRIGNVIQPVSLTTKVNLCVTSRQDPSVSIWAHIFFLTSKSVKDWRNTPSVPTGVLMNKGDGTNTLFDGTSYTAMFPVNKSEFTVIAHKKILLQKGANNPNTAFAATETPSSDTFKYWANFSQKIPLPKELTYLDSVQARPTNSFPFMCMGFTATDQHGDTAPLTLQLRVQGQNHLYYKDA